MRPVIKTLEIPDEKRILAVSDIHGHHRLLRRLLQEAAFGPEDHLFIIGDIIEKGPESLATLRYVMELAGRDNVTVLTGNVDAWRLHMLEDLSPRTAEKYYADIASLRKWWGGSLFDDMAKELGLKLDSPESVLAASDPILKHFKPELDFLRALPAIVETRRYIFVHSGLPSEDLDSLRERDAYEVLRFQDFMSAGLCFDKYVVVGHWPVTLYSEKYPQCNPVVNRAQHIVSIDGGCGLKDDGQLNLLVIPRMDADAGEISWLSCDDLPVYTALTPQAASENSIHIRWGDAGIQILERGAEFTLARHLSSGYTLRIYNPCLWTRDGRDYCSDYTDYRLPVSPGDRLSLVRETPEGYLVKNNGVTGWYAGQLDR